MKRFVEGDLVQVFGALGRRAYIGVVDAAYDGVGRVMVRPDGAAKARPIAVERVRLVDAGIVAVEVNSDAPASITAPDPVIAGQDVEPEYKPKEPERNPATEPAAHCGNPRVGPHEPLSQSRVLGQDQHGASIHTLRSVPKPEPPVRDDRYLAFIREYPCCACGSRDNVEAHHFAWKGRKRLGSKPDDLRTVPLCMSCHEHFHAHGQVKGMTSVGTRVHFIMKQVDYLIAWARRGRS